MLTIIGVVNDKYIVLDQDDGAEDLVTIEELYLYRATGIYIEGCHFTKDGLVVDIDGRLCPRGAVEVPEVWRPVQQEYNILHEDGMWRYEVSNFGNVRSRPYVAGNNNRYGGGEVSQRHNQGGYVMVWINNGRGCRRNVSVHTLVAVAFNANGSCRETVNHLDECKDSNFIWNLEFCSVAENNNYGTRNARLSAAGKRRVRQYSLDGALLAEYDSCLEAQSLFNPGGSCISRCCLRDLPTCYGFVWRYVYDDDLATDKSFFNELKPRRRVVRQYGLNKVFVAEYESVTSASNAVCGNADYRGNICRACNGASETSLGYLWRYVDGDELAELPENRVLIEEFHKRENSGGSSSYF